MNANINEAITNQKEDLKSYRRNTRYFYIVTVISCILTLITMVFLNDNLRAISYLVYQIAVCLSLIPLLTLVLATLLHSFLFLTIINKWNKSKNDHDLTSSVNEYTTPTKTRYKIWKSFVWFFIISTLLLNIGLIVYLSTIFLIN
ncbi:MAG: hypothetical protein JXA54_11775 [Candidatus Heimdallarchaeota archaeon]|nr:hypothetical protein [Candidatus Heimdallarchaeota archaeon]